MTAKSPIYWVLPNKLAGRPGPNKIPWDHQELHREGIGAIVSLAGRIDTAGLRSAKIENLPVHRPMILLESELARADFLSVMPLVLDFVDRQWSKEKRVLVHCHHGHDRTGAVLACVLVAREGMSAEAAVAHVREANPLAMTAFGYEQAVWTFERAWRQVENASNSDT